MQFVNHMKLEFSSLPENEGEPMNSETATEQAAGENAPEQA